MRLATSALVIGLIAGTIADRPQPRPPLMLGGYRVLAADFHVHSSTWSDGIVTPWGLVLEAKHQGLDAIAITGHNQVSDGQLGRWFSERIGGPTMIVGEEILAHDHHVIAVGVDRVVDWRASVADEIDDVHRQGGVAIAAHPTPPFWPAFDAAALARLDGSEICHPLIYRSDDDQRSLEAFAARGTFAAIGSSDFHGVGRLGICRTYVFARDDSAAAILDALRARRTVVYGRGGQAYGDPALVALADTRPELRDLATVDPPVSWIAWVSRIGGLLGLLLMAQRVLSMGR